VRVGRIVVAVLAAVTGGLAAAGPAAGHGAPDRPMSRTAACAPDGPYETAAVCQAALAASDRTAFEDWDYVRVAGVAGRDREVIPDGALCSGGAPGFAGLDLPRAGWPATALADGRSSPSPTAPPSRTWAPSGCT
jgi:chitin-binding protein